MMYNVNPPIPKPDPRLEDVINTIEYLYGCCWQQKGPRITPQDIVEVIHLSSDFPSHDTTCFGIVKLKDGRFLAFEEGCDYTGHG